MLIRSFKENDRGDFLEMMRTFYASDAVCHLVSEKNYVRTFNECLTGNPLVRGLMIEYDDKIAGFGNISFTWSTEAGGMVIWFEELYIKPEFRNLKLGTQFFQKVMEEYRGSACRFRLEVSHNNTAARRLYERLGYQTLDYIQMIIDTPQ